MQPCTTVTTCRTCGEPFDAERSQSMGNPSACVPCATGHLLPAKGSAAYSPTDGAQFTPPTATVVNHRLHGKIGWLYQEDDGSLTLHTRLDIPSGAIIKLPPDTAPRPLPSGRDAGPETTAAGGNPSPNGRWTPPTNCIRCGAPVPRGVATVCCSDCAAEFRTPPPPLPEKLCALCGRPVLDGETVCCDGALKEWQKAIWPPGNKAPLPDEPWDAESEALTLELRRRGIQSIPADTKADYEWRMML